MAEIVIAVGVFVVFGLLMAVGLLVRGRSSCMERGSCGGEPLRIAGVAISCSGCPKRDVKPGDELVRTSEGDADT